MALEESVIPGKYVDKNGGEVTVIAVGFDGDSGEKTVIYRAGSAGLLTLGEKAWTGRFVPAEYIDYENYEAGGSEAELIKKVMTLFQPRENVYSVHWKNTFGFSGYNYACENHSLVSGCYRGTDSCKNCRKGKLSSLDREAVAAHLRGEIEIGIYPAGSDGCCRFLAVEELTRSQAETLRTVCREIDIPCFVESRGSSFRLWVFFAERIPLKYVRRLGNFLITKGMELSPDIGFELYDRFVPCRDEIAAGSFGFEIVLPFGKVRKNASSCFVDERFEPLAGGAAQLFRVRTVTRGYLSDRLAVLGNQCFGRLWDGVSLRPGPAEFPAGMKVVLDCGAAVAKKGLPIKTQAMLKRMACIKNAERPYDEFESLSPCISANFTEDSDYLRLPRGLWDKVENLLEVSRADYTVAEGFPERETVRFSLLKEIPVRQLATAEELGRRFSGILTAPLGWGKTAAVAELINEKKTPTLILTADETTRVRWAERIMDYFGVDAQRPGAKIQVRIITDEKVRDKYGLIILADCSRLPMDEGIFKRISALRPRFIYGITADDSRRDGKWGFIHMLCGPEAFRG